LGEFVGNRVIAVLSIMININSTTDSKKKKTTKGKTTKVAERRKKVLKNILIMSIFVLFASFLWVVLEGYHLLLSKEMVKEADILVKPLNPEIDVEMITQARNRRFYSMDQIDSYYQSVSALPTEPIVEESTGSAQLESESQLNGQE
jgi:hypothetical protein